MILSTKKSRMASVFSPFPIILTKNVSIQEWNSCSYK